MGYQKKLVVAKQSSEAKIPDSQKGQALPQVNKLSGLIGSLPENITNSSGRLGPANKEMIQVVMRDGDTAEAQSRSALNQDTILNTSSAKLLANERSAGSLHSNPDEENQISPIKMQAKMLPSPSKQEHTASDTHDHLDAQAQKLKDIAGKRQSQKINEE